MNDTPPRTPPRAPAGLTLRPPVPEDAEAVEAILDAAFGPGRRAKTSYRFRRGRDCIKALSRVACDESGLIGTIRYWPVGISGPAGAAVRALLLGPIGVAPRRQGTGVGRALMRETLGCAAGLGHRIVVLVGPEHYYGPFGFARAAPLGVTMPGEAPERLLISGLAPGALAGVAGEIIPAEEN
ncbi:MAG: GNAT family N-acetyltransferase [Rhodospirillales bacterium]